MSEHRARYTVVVEAGYLEVYRQVRRSDAQAAKRVRRAVRDLEYHAEDNGSIALSSGRYRRLHLGEWRILYEIDHTEPSDSNARALVRVWTLGRAFDHL